MATAFKPRRSALRRQDLAGRIQYGATAAIMAAGLLLFSAGCGGSGSNNAGFGNNGVVSSSTNLSGTYDLTGLSASGKAVVCPTSTSNSGVGNVLTVNNVEADRCYIGENIVFGGGNTYTIIYPAPRFLNLTVESGTYSLSGNTLTLSRNRRSYDSNNDGIIAASEVVSISPSQNVSGSITLSNGTLTFTPQNSDVSTDIARSVDGSSVSRIFTKRAQ